MRSLTALLCPLLLTASACAGSLQDEVRGLVGSLGPRKGTVAVSIRDSEGREVVNIRGDEPVRPASNQKLLTTGTALRMLGPDFAFQTRLLRCGDRLVVVGDGDPAFGDPELLKQMSYTDPDGTVHQGMTIDRLLSLWTDAAKAQGITSVRELVVDDRVFDRGTCHADWPVDQLHEGYCAEVAGLNFHLNRLDFWGTPSPRGAEVTRTEPACRFVSIRNDTKPGKTREDGLWIQREVDANNFTIHGFLRQPLQAPVGVTVDNPSAFFANLLAERLHDAGVQVGAVRLAEMTEPTFSGTDVGPVIRTPLRSAITRCNVDSQNLYAECLLKRIGHAASGAPGSWNNGTEAMQRQVVSRVGHAAGLQPVDGSGLSRNNRVTTSLLTAWVNDLLHDPALSETFLNSLAVGGKSGTVQKRFRDLDARLASVHCKTGYIDGVCSLSGVVQCTNGQQPTFSVICNDFESGGVSRARQLQEAVVKAIAQSYGRLPARQAPAEHPAMGGS